VPELPSDPLTPPASVDDSVRIHSTAYLHEAMIIESLLREEGISCFIGNEHASMLSIGLPTPAALLEVWVAKSDAERAVEIIRGRRASVSAQEPKAEPLRRRRRWPTVLLVVAAFIAFSVHPVLELEHLWLTGGAFMALAWALLVHLHASHRHCRLPFWPVGVAFACGGCAATLASTLLSPVWAGILECERENAAHAFFVVGPVEEIAKAAVVLVPAALIPALRRERYALFLALAASGAGFALTENMFAGFDTTSITGLQLFFLRLVGFWHLAWSALPGLSLTWRERPPEQRVFAFAGLLLISMLLHGAWDAVILEELEGFLLILTPLNAYLLWLVARVPARAEIPPTPAPPPA
jgi:RsiW-degrading membrane proteinase PrsW (M82 family)